MALPCKTSLTIINTGNVSLCESVCVLSGYSYLKNISDNIRTERVSLSCESVCVWSSQSYLQNISDNIDNDVVSL